MIPKLIHRAWLGGPEPEWTRPFAETWLHPGWTLAEWTDANIESVFPLVNQDIFDRAEEIAPNHVGQLRADVLRYELLWRFGGVWVDTDSECLKPLDPLIEDTHCFAAWEVQTKWIANGLMGAVPHHPFIWRLIDGLAANVRREHGNKPNRMSGPRFLTRLWFQYGEHDDVRVLPQRLIYPYGWNELEREHEDFPDAYQRHWWHNKRRERGCLPA